MQLAEKGDLALLENLVRKSPEVLSEKDECGASPLHHAAAGGYITLIQFITSVADSQGRHASAIHHKLRCGIGKICVLCVTRKPIFEVTVSKWTVQCFC